MRQGFRWWEIDLTFYVLKALSLIGLVWDLKSPPEARLRNEQRLGSRVIDRAAGDLIEGFHIESISIKLVHARRPHQVSRMFGRSLRGPEEGP